LKEKLRNDAATEGLTDPKMRSFFHDHIDVIVREDYVSSDSEHSDETPRKINVKSASESAIKLAGASRDGRSSNVTPSKGATSSSKASASTTKLPEITPKK
jgi:hypothetical protein